MGAPSLSRAASIYITEFITCKQSGTGNAEGWAFPQSSLGTQEPGGRCPLLIPKDPVGGGSPGGVLAPVLQGRLGCRAAPSTCFTPSPPSAGSDCLPWGLGCSTTFWSWRCPQGLAPACLPAWGTTDPTLVFWGGQTGSASRNQGKGTGVGGLQGRRQREEMVPQAQLLVAPQAAAPGSPDCALTPCFRCSFLRLSSERATAQVFRSLKRSCHVAAWAPQARPTVHRRQESSTPHPRAPSCTPAPHQRHRGPQTQSRD